MAPAVVAYQLRWLLHSCTLGRKVTSAALEACRLFWCQRVHNLLEPKWEDGIC